MNRSPTYDAPTSCCGEISEGVVLRDSLHGGQCGYDCNLARPYLRSRPCLVAQHFPQLLEWFYRRNQNIPDAALSLDDTWRTRIDLQLAPQSQDLDVDAPIENILMHTGRLQQMLPCQGPLRCLKKG